MTNTHPIIWNYALLRQDPFPNVPPREPKDAVWAGFPRLKELFERVFSEALTTSATKVFLTRGTWGSGKTHAAIYYGVPERLPMIEGEQQVAESLILYIRVPKEPAQANVILYQNILEAIGFGRLRTIVRNLIEVKGQQDALKLLQDSARSEVLGKHIWLLGLEQRGGLQLTLFDPDHEQDEWRRMLEASFYSQATRADLKQLGLSRSINSSQDRFRVLSTIFQAIVGFESVGKIAEHRRIILWMDEMEDLLSYTKRYHRPFTQGLRDLIDYVPDYLTLMLNFTLTVPEDLEEIRVILGEALWDRINYQIFMREPTLDEAFEYVFELLSTFRTPSSAKFDLPATYPITEEVLKQVIETLPSHTPRDLNQRMSTLISAALQQGIIEGEGQGIIDRNFVSDFDALQVETDLGY